MKIQYLHDAAAEGSQGLIFFIPPTVFGSGAAGGDVWRHFCVRLFLFERSGRGTVRHPPVVRGRRSRGTRAVW